MFDDQKEWNMISIISNNFLILIEYIKILLPSDDLLI